MKKNRRKLSGVSQGHELLLFHVIVLAALYTLPLLFAGLKDLP